MTLLRSIGESLLRLMEESEDALSVWDDPLLRDDLPVSWPGGEASTPAS